MKGESEVEKRPGKCRSGKGDDLAASRRAVSMARVIDRLCRAPGTYQITIVVPVHRRSPWQITYAKVEVVRQENVARGDR